MQATRRRYLNHGHFRRGCKQRTPRRQPRHGPAMEVDRPGGHGFLSGRRVHRRARRWTCAVAGVSRHEQHHRWTAGSPGSERLRVGYLCPVLTEAGYTDVAYRLLENETYPSWGYTVKNGATTIWERWDGWTEENGFQSPNMNSFNHYSLGSVGEWLYRYVAGIDLG